MNYNNPTVPTIASPALLDKAIKEIQTQLSTLSWLDKAFARAYKAVEERDGKKFYYPEIYVGNGEYLSMMPNDNMDSYCFFDRRDPDYVEDDGVNIGAFSLIRSTVSIVFYWNLERIDSTKTYRYGELLKKDILGILHRGLTLGPIVKVNAIYEDIEKVFEGYTIDASKTQLFKHPWQGMRFECTITYREEC